MSAPSLYEGNKQDELNVKKFKYLLQRSQKQFFFFTKFDFFDLPHFREEFKSFWFDNFEELNCY